MAPPVASTKFRLLLQLVAAAIISYHLRIVAVASLDSEPKLEAAPMLPEPSQLELVDTNSTGETTGDFSSGSRASVRKNKNNKSHKCGLAPLNRLSRRKSRSVVGPDDQVAAQVVNGQDESYGSWPSFVTLGFHQSSTGMRFVCGGTLVTDRHVLTAAHCTNYNGGTLYRPDEITVKIGDHSKSRIDQYEARLPVKRVYQSPNFRPTGSIAYDWTILELKSPVKFSDHVQPACLAQTMPATKGSKAVCYVVGAGATRGSNRKREIKSPSEEDEEEDEAGESRRAATPSKRAKSGGGSKDLVQELRVIQTDCSSWGLSQSDRSRMCFIGATPGDSCSGDSGGPILCLNSQNKWTVTGIVSYGSTRCDHRPAVYGDVHKLLGDMMRVCPSIKGYPMS